MRAMSRCAGTLRASRSSLSLHASPVLLWAAEQARYLSVRDAPSLEKLRQAGVSGPVRVVPDSALDVGYLWPEMELHDASASLFADAGRSLPDRTLALHLNDRYISDPAPVLAKRLDRIAERSGATLVLIALGPCHGDDRLARSVGGRMRSRAAGGGPAQSLSQIVAVIARSEAYLGSSMHGMITAAAFGRPGIVVGHEHEGGGKFSGFLGQFELGHWLVADWHEAEDRVGELLETGPAEVARVVPAAAPLLDEHWTNISEALLEAKKPRRRAGAKSHGAPSVEGIMEEGIESLLAVANREHRRAVAKERSELEARLAAPGEMHEALHEANASAAERELELQRRLAELEALRIAAEHRLEITSSELERRAADVRAITEVLKQREDTFRAAIEAQQEATGALARLQGRLARAQARQAEAQAAAARLSSVEAQLTETRTELDEARRRAAERDAILSRLSDAIEHARGEQEAMQARLVATEEEMATADRLSEDLEAELARVSQERTDLLAATEQRVNETETARADAVRRAEHADAELRQVVEKLQALAERAAAAEHEVAELREQLRASDESHAEQRRRSDALDAEVGEQRKRAAESSAALEDVSSELEREGAQRRSLERLLEESLERERTLRDRLVLERDSLEGRLDATLAALNERRLPRDGRRPAPTRPGRSGPPVRRAAHRACRA